MNEIDAAPQSGNTANVRTTGNSASRNGTHAYLAAGPFLARFFSQRKLGLVLGVLAGVVVLDVVATRLQALSLTGLDHVYWASPIAVLAAAAYGLSRQRGSTISGVWARISVSLFCLCLLTAFALAALVLQASAVSTHLDLIDDRLVQIDAALGFHWRPAYQWFEAHPLIFETLRFCYRLYGWQVALLPVLLAFLGRLDDLADFLLLFCVCVVLTILISALIPASNPHIYFGRIGAHELSEWSQFAGFREGLLHTIDLNDNQGLISLPSLHAAHAVIFTYAARHLRGWNVLIAALNVLMTISAVPFGAHYLIDIIAGIALAVTVIHLSRRMTGRAALAPQPS